MLALAVVEVRALPVLVLMGALPAVTQAVRPLTLWLIVAVVVAVMVTVAQATVPLAVPV